MKYVMQSSHQLFFLKKKRLRKHKKNNTIATEQCALNNPEVAGAEENVKSLQATIETDPKPLQHIPIRLSYVHG